MSRLVDVAVMKAFSGGYLTGETLHVNGGMLMD